MKKTIFCALLIWPMMTFAQAIEDWLIAVPNTPANGDVADVTKLNANFDYLEDILSFTYAKGANFTLGATNAPTVFWDEDNNSENVTGVGNLGIGFEVLDDLRLGIANVAYGWQALSELNDGTHNTAVGTSAASELTGGSFNTAVGASAGFGLSSGSHNVAIGRYALGDTNTGNRNIAIGHDSNANAFSDYENISIGDMAMRNHTGGHRNVAIGSDALGGFDDREGLEKNMPTTGHSNVAVGPGTLRENTGDLNVAIGAYASSSAGHNFCVVWRSALAPRRRRTRSPLAPVPRLPGQTQWLWVPMPR